MTDFADEAHELRKLNEQLKRKLERARWWAEAWKELAHDLYDRLRGPTFAPGTFDMIVDEINNIPPEALDAAFRHLHEQPNPILGGLSFPSPDKSKPAATLPTWRPCDKKKEEEGKT